MPAADRLTSAYQHELNLAAKDVVGLAGPDPNDNGPADIRTKAQVIEYGAMTKAAVASGIAYHSYNHYGQMVVYARMNGVVPPASN